jgi:hypothetical protein
VQAIFAYLREELFVAYQPSALSRRKFVICEIRTLLSPEQTNKQDASAVNCKQRTDRVELGGKDLEYDESERELADCCADIGTFECSLCCTDFHKLVTCQHD